MFGDPAVLVVAVNGGFPLLYSDTWQPGVVGMHTDDCFVLIDMPKEIILSDNVEPCFFKPLCVFIVLLYSN